jgi:ankyrin repeat protein
MHFSFMVTLVVGAALGGCGNKSSAMKATWYEKFGWKAEDYFDDTKVIALCRAIETNNIKKVEQLVAEGANLNSQGKDNMTPLLWSFPDKKLACFTRLLELGADPNVGIKNDLNTHGGFAAGDSVTHMACRTEFPGYFEAVFAHGGNPNLVKNSTFKGDTPLFSVIMGAAPDKNPMLKVLIDKGADVNHINGSGDTPLMMAVGWGGRYDLALTLLYAGADYKIYKPKTNTRLIHIVAMEERRKSSWTPQQAADYQNLVNWLEAHGESIATAKTDIKRWQSWGLSNGEYRKKMDAEIAARKANEAREKANGNK